jgi:hypothetical protein
MQGNFAMNRFHQVILIVSTIVASWLAMQMVHEFGHVLGAWLTGGEFVRVVIHPLTISRTDLGYNPRPLVVVWSGPLVGVLLPLGGWGLGQLGRMRGTFLLRFFAGFCLIANGAYLAFGSLDRVGDCGEMLRHGSSLWHLWLFGTICIPTGFWLWHRQGKHFGLGPQAEKVKPGVAYSSLGIVVVLLLLGLVVGGE